jgi:outer membrane biogenesis lipoprotein LolB
VPIWPSVILSQTGVNCLLGDLFGRPIPLDHLETWLEDNAAKTGQGCAAPVAANAATR